MISEFQFFYKNAIFCVKIVKFVINRDGGNGSISATDLETVMPIF